MSKQSLIEGVDYYLEEKNGVKFKVFTELYHIKRGFCCQNNCRHCAYGFNKKTKMNKSSLEQFNSLVDSHYIGIKKYITHSDEKKITLEDYENFAWGKNPDLAPLLEKPCPFPVTNLDVSYIEKDCMFKIILTLK